MGESEARIITHSSQRLSPKRHLHLKEQLRRVQALDGVSLPISGIAEAPAVPKVQSRRVTKRQGRPPDKSVEQRRKVMRRIPKKASLEDFCEALDDVGLAVPDWPGQPGSWHQAWKDPLLRQRIKSMRVCAYATAK